LIRTALAIRDQS